MNMANVDPLRNQYIQKRAKLLETLEAPTISDVKKNFGEGLAQIIFCNCHPNFREDLGVEPPLKGPIGGDLWTSPSDLLIGKVCLKPPLTTKYIKALTHQGIMDIGSQIEKMFWNQLEIEKSKELNEQERTLRLVCEFSKREEIAEVRAKMLEVFKRQRLELINEMDELCKDEMRRMDMKYYVDLQDELKEQAKALEEYYKVQMEVEKEKTSEILIVKSTADMEELETSIKVAFQRQLQKAEIFARFEIQKERSRCKEKLKSLQHELECRNLANMMYLLCAERKKCETEKYNTETQLTDEIRELQSEVKDKKDEIDRIKAERDKHKREIELREKALLEIIKEFQKFINFALKAVPKQAEYLLSAEKLMVFELTDALSKVPIVEDDDHDRNYLWNKTPEMSGSSGGSIKVKDGHDCLRQPEVDESEYSVGRFLPGFFYNDQLYVREDFRNMISQGVTINESNMLWDRHVQDILDRLEQPCQSCNISNNGSRVLEKEKSVASCPSSVHFSLKEKDKASMMSFEKERKFCRTSLKSSEPENVIQSIDFSHIGYEEKRKTLISSRNSLELLRARRQSSMKNLGLNNAEPNQERELSDEKDIPQADEREILEADEKEISQDDESNSPVLTKHLIEKTNIQQNMGSQSKIETLEDESRKMLPKRKESKLIATTDSVEVIKRRESMMPFKFFKERRESHSLKTNSEETVTKITDKESATEFDAAEPSRTISITFTGTSVIKETTYSGDNIRKNKISKHTAKSKKTKSIRSHKIIRKKCEQENMRLSPIDQDITEGPQSIIYGDSSMNFCDQSEGPFTSDRIKSFINILKDHPNLIRLFTSVTR